METIICIINIYYSLIKMSAVFFKHKRRRRIPTAVFSLKNEDEIIVKLKGTYEPIEYNCIGRNTYKIPIVNNINILLIISKYTKKIKQELNNQNY